MFQDKRKFEHLPRGRISIIDMNGIMKILDMPAKRYGGRERYSPTNKVSFFNRFIWKNLNICGI